MIYPCLQYAPGGLETHAQRESIPGAQYVRRSGEWASFVCVGQYNRLIGGNRGTYRLDLLVQGGGPVGALSDYGSSQEETQEHASLIPQTRHFSRHLFPKCRYHPDSRYVLR